MLYYTQVSGLVLRPDPRKENLSQRPDEELAECYQGRKGGKGGMEVSLRMAIGARHLSSGSPQNSWIHLCEYHQK